MSEPPRESYGTHASIFDKLKASDPGARDLAWAQFRDRYAPVIAGFARNLGARPQDVDDVIQDVFLGFFAVSPKFVYDRSKGRFRGYLKTITLRAIRARAQRQAKEKATPLDQVDDEDAPSVQQSWDLAWQKNLLRRAMELARQEYAGRPETFEAFVQYALHDRPVADVARELGMSTDSVYQAKHRVMGVIRAKLRELDAED